MSRIVGKDLPVARAPESARKELNWLRRVDAKRLLKLTERQIEVLELVLSCKSRFNLSELAVVIGTDKQGLWEAVSQLQARQLVELERVNSGRQKPFVAKPGAFLKALAKVPPSKLPH